VFQNTVTARRKSVSKYGTSVMTKNWLCLTLPYTAPASKQISLRVEYHACRLAGKLANRTRSQPLNQPVAGTAVLSLATLASRSKKMLA
jgi:hypothetical protein